MIERPILFHGEMVKAILAGNKTMTRRIIKPQPVDIGENAPYIQEPKQIGEGIIFNRKKYIKCPYGMPDDRLWVRETFSQHPEYVDFAYRADGEDEYEDSDGGIWEPKWTPSIFMPRKFSRILLEIVNIRVERLQQITRADALNEGITWDANTDGFAVGNKGCCFHGSDPVISFIKLWNSINADRYPWDNNPYVWVIEFRRIK